MTDLIPYIIGVGVGYFACSYLVGKHIEKKVEDAMNEHMLEVSWLFVNTRSGEEYDVTAGFTYED